MDTGRVLGVHGANFRDQVCAHYYTDPRRRHRGIEGFAGGSVDVAVLGHGHFSVP